MHEEVRLVIWDLDETFWRGTFSEGGILEYIQEHHDLIVELARRGIMSSICSKNNAVDVLEILESKGIADYFIFPNISWDAKGPRLASIIKATNLRASTVMFVDDNANNRAEALAVVPGIQVEDETFICQMLDDVRFRGKDDKGLTRLRQYKLLEARTCDEVMAAGDNREFLRGCDIRVYIEHDVSGHIDRAIEIINRTNQLNYTKKRLPEDQDKARLLLREQCRLAANQVGLIRVMDRYGDYGFVGFFMMRNGRASPSYGLSMQTLVHYCFSCRTLGMLVEHWFYRWLRCPELHVVGEVLTDLAETTNVDWIKMVSTISENCEVTEKVSPEFRVHGGCEANAVAHYLGTYSDSIKVAGNFAAGGLFVRINSAELLLSACRHAGATFESEMRLLGIPSALLGTHYFDAVSEGTVFVFSGAYDSQPGQPRYRHRVYGWTIKVEVSGHPINLVSASEEEASGLFNLKLDQEEKIQLESAVKHLRKNYDSVQGASGLAVKEITHNLLRQIPAGCKLIVLLDDERVKQKDGTVVTAPWTKKYNEEIPSMIADFPFVAALSFADFIKSEDDIQIGGNHYDRSVFWRVAEKIAEVSGKLPVKSPPHTK